MQIHQKINANDSSPRSESNCQRTHMRDGIYKYCIDLVFVNNTHRIVSHGVQEFEASDHSVTFMVKKVGVCKAHMEIRDVRSFKHYNKDYFQRDIASVPWSVIESFDDINDAVIAWNNLFVDVANQHAPLKRVRTNHVSKPWITNDLKELMAERDYALRVAKRSGNQEQWNEKL